MARKRGKGEKLGTRGRTKRRIRKRIEGTEAKPRLSVFKSSLHTYVQLISDVDSKTLLSASTLDKDIKPVIEQVVSELGKDKGNKNISSSKSCNAAFAVGLLIAKRCKDKNISQVVFDRGGYKYCGRVQAVADGARKGGLQF